MLDNGSRGVRVGVRARVGVAIAPRVGVITRRVTVGTRVAVEMGMIAVRVGTTVRVREGVGVGVIVATLGMIELISEKK